MKKVILKKQAKKSKANKASLLDVLLEVKKLGVDLENLSKKTSEEFQVAAQNLESLAISTAKGFADADRKHEEFKSETKDNFSIVNSKVSNIILEQERLRNKQEAQNDKVNNVLYFGQEVRRLEERVEKLENKN